MIANIDTITALVECPSCRWKGQVAACNPALNEIVHCPLCRCPVESECDEPVILHTSERGEWDPMGITK